MESNFEVSIERLINAVNNIIFMTPDEMIIVPSRNDLKSIQNCLNDVFGDKGCTEVLFTNNLDKLYFGIKVSPQISQSDVVNIVMGEEKVQMDRYKVEFDSRVFNMGLDAIDITAYLIYEISSMMYSYDAIDKLRGLVDTIMTEEKDTIYLRDSVYYAGLVAYAFKDTLTKITSLIYKDESDEYIYNPYIHTANLEDALITAHDTIISSEIGPKDSMRSTNTTILNWMFIMYRDMAMNSSTVMDQLRDARDFTGSELEKLDIDIAIDAVNHIDNSLPLYESVDNRSLIKFLEDNNLSSVVNELSIFGGLKRNGLRSIEDSLYEYALQIKNLETEEEALYVMRAINTRISILQDYLYNTPDMRPAEREHYEQVVRKFMELREALTKKRIWNKKQYGIFVDYDQLDRMDEGYEDLLICPQCQGTKISVTNGQCNCNECGNTFPLAVQEGFKFGILPDFMERKELRNYYDDLNDALEMANDQKTMDTVQGLRTFQRVMHIFTDMVTLYDLALMFISPVIGLACYIFGRICSGINDNAEVLQARNSGKMAIQNLKQAKKSTKDPARQKLIDKSIKKIEKSIKKLDERFD